jgi:undecaprenyl-diphosphatase
LATIPAILAGLLFKDWVERAFTSPRAAGLFLLGTAALLVIAEWLGKRRRKMENITWLDALIVGLFQAVSLLPGISRSGATISGGMLRNFDRPSAARFSFLMSVPVMIGAGILAGVDLIQSATFNGQIIPLAIGFITAAIVGYLAIRWLLSYLTKRPLTAFAVYCLVACVIVIFFTVIRA